MKTNQAIKVFGSKYRIAQLLEIDKSAVTRWGDLVPELRARQLADLSGGKLTFNPRPYRKAAA